MNVMNRKLPVILLLLIIPFGLTACTLADVPVIGGLFGGSSKNTPVTISMWGLWESPEVMSSMAEKYRTEHPNVTINYDDRSVLTPEDYKERVFSRLGTESNLDVLLVHNTWVKGLSTLLSPLPTTVMDATEYKDKFYPVAEESATVDGNIYAVPAFYDGLVLVYNKDHFKEIDQLEPPTSWEEFRKLAIELTVKGADSKIVRAGAAIGTANNIDFFSDILGLLLAQTGAKIPDDMDSRAAQDALLFYTDFVKEYGVWDNSFPEASTSFAEEKVSMIIVPSWNLLDILNARPDLNIGVAPVPQALESNPVSWGSFWMYVVPANSTNKAAAWEYIKYLTQQDQQLAAYNNATQFRQYGAPFSLASLASQVTSNPYIGPVLQSAPFAKSGIIAGRSGNVVQVSALKDAVNAVLESKNNSVSAATVLKTAKSTISQSR
jgi:multiple sugar transport system substrate-binding protein